MKAIWYFISMILFLSILGVLSGMSSPTGSFGVNLPPKWDSASIDFKCVDNVVSLDLKKVFFDPDGDVLAFSVSPGPGISAGVSGDELAILCESDGFVVVSVSDGKNIVSQKIFVYN